MVKQLLSNPKLRFSEFKDNWNSTIISATGKTIGGGTPSTKDSENWNGEIPWISSSDLFEDSIYKININRHISKKAISKSATKIIPPKSVLIVSRVGVGKVAINEHELCTSQDFTNLIPINDNYIFLAYLIKLKTNELLEFNQGTSIKGFVKSDFDSLKINIPSLPEQKKIASFLTSIDTKIQQLTQKKTLLERYKKGVMQKIFNQEIRFKDENSKEFPEWEEKPLGELLDFEQPTKYIVSSTEYDNSYQTPVLTAGKTFILGYTNETEGIFNKNLPVIIFDDFTTATQFVDFPFKVKSSAMKILSAKKGFNVTFIYEAMQNLDYVVGGHERHWISKYSQLLIQVPYKAEQDKIAIFLAKISKKIDLVNTQLEKTKEWKKGLLQQLFV